MVLMSSHKAAIPHQLHSSTLIEKEQLLPLVLREKEIVLFYICRLKAKDPGSLSGLSVEYVSVCVSMQRRSRGLRWGVLLSALAHSHTKSSEYSLL